MKRREKVKEKQKWRINNFICFMILDYINSKIRILWYTDPSLISREGLILLETEKTFLIRLRGKNKVIRIFKAHGIFEITFKGKSFIIAGYRLVRKPWRRI